MQQEDMKKYIEEAKNNAHAICIPIKEVSIDGLISLVKEAKRSKVEVRLWHETSNFHQGVLVELQRFHDRVDCTPLKVSVIGK